MRPQRAASECSARFALYPSAEIAACVIRCWGDGPNSPTVGLSRKAEKISDLTGRRG
jgi:hypothetical protein